MFENGSIECMNVRSNPTGMRGNSNTNLDSNRSMRSSDCNCIKNDNGYSCSITNDDSSCKANGYMRGHCMSGIKTCDQRIKWIMFDNGSIECINVRSNT